MGAAFGNPCGIRRQEERRTAPPRAFRAGFVDFVGIVEFVERPRRGDACPGGRPGDAIDRIDAIDAVGRGAGTMVGAAPLPPVRRSTADARRPGARTSVVGRRTSGAPAKRRAGAVGAAASARPNLQSYTGRAGSESRKSGTRTWRMPAKSSGWTVSSVRRSFGKSSPVSRRGESSRSSVSGSSAVVATWT